MLKNAVNGKIYVGQSVHTWRRWHEHKKSAKRGDKSYLYDAMRKYGATAFELTVLEECDPLQFDERESYWLAFYDAQNPEKGYNYMPAGQRGRVLDAAMREKMSASMRGRKMPVEVVEKIRIANTGRKHSEETKQKIAAAHKGRTLSTESTAKLGAALKARWECMSAEEKAAYAAARSGYRHTPEARSKMSQARKGRPKSEETRARMREARRNEAPELKERRATALREANARRWAAYRAEKAQCL